MSQEPAPTAAKRRFPLVPVLVGVIVMMTAASGGGYWWLVHGSGKDAVAVPPGLVRFDPLLVNLSGGGSNRFLRVSLRLLVEGEARAAAIEGDEVAMTQLRSAILELLAVQRADHLTTPDGKAALKAAIGERAAATVPETKVVDVLFTEFVVQF